LKLFLFPHQDDEYFAIPSLLDDPTQSICIFLTKGSFYGSDSTQRNFESLSVLLKLNIPKENIIFLNEILNIEDTKLVFGQEEVLQWIVQKYTNDSGQALSSIYTTAFEGGHPDHDSAAMISMALGKILQIPVFYFFTYHSHPFLPYFFRVAKPFKNLKTSELKIKSPNLKFTQYLLFLKYKSQWKTWIVLAPFLWVRYFLTRKYYLYSPTSIDFHLPPHPEKLYYEFRNWMSFTFFTQTTKEFQYKYLRENK